MEAINKYNEHIISDSLMPLNFKLLHIIKVNKFMLPEKMGSKLYQCIYLSRIKYHKPLENFKHV